MANKSIIPIEINDAQFKAFYELFEQFESKIQGMPKEWQQIDSSMRRNAATAKSLASGIQSSTEAQRQFNVMAREGLHTMSKMAKEASNVGKAVFDIGKWLLKFGAIGGGIAGLGGILGAISLRDLAHSAVTEQRGARGVGLTPGQYKAFGMDFGRFLDPSILSHVADAQNSYQGRVWLGLATGLGSQAVANQGPDQLAIRLATRAHDWWTKTPASQRTAENLSAAGFTQSGLTLEDMRRLGNTPLSELNAARSQYSRDQRSLNVSNGTTQAWYEFDRQITLAGRTLETSLTNRLVELAPSLRAFVTTLTKDADQLINDIFTPKNLKAVSDGITSLTTYLGSPGFKQDLKDFADGIADIVGAIRKVGKFFGGGGPETDAEKAAAWAALQPTTVDKLAGGVQKLTGEPNYFPGMEKAQGLPAGLMYAQEMVESRGDINAVSPRGAKGPFQFMPAAAEQYGLKDPFNLHDSADANSRMMGDLMRKYRGDIRKALAAYNWGQGNLDKDIAKNGAQWEQGLPAETRKYIASITAEMAKRTGVKVKVEVSNNTSARVAVQANAAAPGM
ncbi:MULTISPECIES: lytic transglycosylase domain-containing protein [Burkholderia]|uniref:lytic transglycosylase domain-containing protein n=1 Tax=Burkholderia TaxID=32008 RepID=UPI0007567108|nr:MULTISPECIES: lytic transglycosylase domain-containing protein [Burkholderia]AOJ69336.1 transglycosylase [Burkholderia savannae]KVG37454.1 transglycosylase [Burkholderia sp. MSMB0265]KVG88282.1 transglycosylase [Burkholderia sp. MSMB2040]KVG93833.1 transglycosylase [Burkholderia sp. MSMB2041]KVH01085.1 transglycosylase [Burkholderia sp. MSMB2042]